MAANNNKKQRFLDIIQELFSYNITEQEIPDYTEIHFSNSEIKGSSFYSNLIDALRDYIVGKKYDQFKAGEICFYCLNQQAELEALKSNITLPVNGELKQTNLAIAIIHFTKRMLEAQVQSKIYYNAYFFLSKIKLLDINALVFEAREISLKNGENLKKIFEKPLDIAISNIKYYEDFIVPLNLKLLNRHSHKEGEIKSALERYCINSTYEIIKLDEKDFRFFIADKQCITNEDLVNYCSNLSYLLINEFGVGRKGLLNDPNQKDDSETKNITNSLGDENIFLIHESLSEIERIYGTTKKLDDEFNEAISTTSNRSLYVNERIDHLKKIINYPYIIDVLKPDSGHHFQIRLEEIKKLSFSWIMQSKKIDDYNLADFRSFVNLLSKDFTGFPVEKNKIQYHSLLMLAEGASIANHIFKIDLLRQSAGGSDQIEALLVEPKSEKAKPSVKAYAIMHVFLERCGGQGITETNKKKLAAKYGWSEISLRNTFRECSKDDFLEHINHGNKKSADSKIINFKKALELLESQDHKALLLAKETFSRLQVQYDKYYFK